MAIRPVPRRTRARRSAGSLGLTSLLLLVMACGEGSSPTGTQPPGSTPTTPVATSIVLSLSSVSLFPGGQQAIAATVRDQTGAAITGQVPAWSSGALGVATVNSTGVVTAVAAGSATVTATLGSLAASATVTVTALAPTAVAVSPVADTVQKGDTIRLTATVTDQQGAVMPTATVTWTSAQPSAATVAGGLVTGVGAGSSLITATAGTASGVAQVTVLDPPGPYLIDTSLDLVSLRVGSTDTIKVFARDVDTDELIGFQNTTGGACVSASSNGTSEIYLTAVGFRCEQSILVTAPGVDKIITARTYEMASLHLGDGLYMTYTNEYESVYNSSTWESSGMTNSWAWHPVKPGTGWRPVGDHLQTNYTRVDLDGNVPMVMLFDATRTHLASPTDYEKIWDNSIEGTVLGLGDRGASAAQWKPVCPTGFVALGSVATTGGKPALNRVDCVAEQFTTLAKVEDARAAYSDRASGSSEDLRMYQVAAPTDPFPRSDGKSTLWARSQFGCPGYALTDCDPAFPRLLLIPMTVVEKGADDRPLREDRPFQARGPSSSARVRVPFTMVPSLDPTCQTAECAGAAAQVAGMVQNSPFVFLERYASYEPLSLVQGTKTTTSRLSWALQKCYEQTESTGFSRTIGMEITTTAEAKFKGVGGSVAVSLSQEFGWTYERAVTYGTCSTTTSEFDIPAGFYGQVVGQRETFQAVLDSGQNTGAPFSFNVPQLVRFLLYPIP